MAGVLIIPRVEVMWGSDNLTFYEPSAEWTPSGMPQPLVYDCSAKQAEEGETPGGSMRWMPTGPAFAVYEEFVSSKEKLAETITMRWYYANGRSITFFFIWGGHRMLYGTETEIEIQLVSELEGIYNTVARNVSQSAEDEDQGIMAKDAMAKLEGQFGTSDMFDYSKKADEDNQKYYIRDQYAEDSNLISAAGNLQEQNGNYTMANAIGKPSIVVHTPFTFDTEKIEEPISDPDPKKRYGYFLGPSIYSTIERTYQWQPPQLSQNSQGNFQTKVTPKGGSAMASWYGPGFIGNKTANGETFTGTGMTAAHKTLPFGTQVKVTNQNNGQSAVVRINDRGPYVAGREIDLSQAAAQKIGMMGTGTAPVTLSIMGKTETDNAEYSDKPTTAPVGTSRAKPNPGIRSVTNPDGPKKQELGKEERQSALSLSTLMVPALVGVKPHDILFVPDFKGTFMEDWIVKSVEYRQQGGTGEIQVSVQAGRTYASGSLMNKVSEEWLEKAKAKGLCGGNVSIENWEAYAWELSNTGGSTPAASLKAPELGGATTLGGLTSQAKSAASTSITTGKGDILPLDVG